MVEERTGELRASQASLLALKNHLSTVIANVGTGVVSLDREGRIETFNGRAGEILGVSPGVVAGRTLEDVLGGAQLAGIVQAVAVVRGGRQPRHEAQVACELPQGRRTLSVTASELLGEGRAAIGTVVVIEDLTQILASQRLEAWKEAVERVIHEIKNPLTPVGLAAQTLKAAWSHDRARFADLFPSAIDMILGAVRDLKDLIGEFSRFSRLPADARRSGCRRTRWSRRRSRPTVRSPARRRCGWRSSSRPACRRSRPTPTSSSACCST